MPHPTFPADCHSKTDKLRARLGLIILILGTLTACQQEATNYIAHNGVIDLRDWSPERQPLITLDGQWTYHWNQLSDPKSFHQDPELTSHGYMKVPLFWNDISHPERPDQTLGSYGYMTLSLKLLLPDDFHLKSLSLVSRGSNSSAALYVVQRGHVQKVLEHGQVGKSYEESTPEWSIQLNDFELDPSKPLTVVWHISNYHHHYGGTWDVPTLGTNQIVHSKIQQNKNLLSAMLGIFLLMGIYHFGIFMQRPQRDAILWFSFLCLSFAISVASFNYFFFIDSWLPSTARYITQVKALSISPVLVEIFTILYFATTIPSPWFQKFTRFSVIILSGLCLVMLFNSPTNLAAFFLPAIMVGSIFTIPIIIHVTQAILKNDQEARLLLLATGSLALGGALDLLAGFGVTFIDIPFAGGLGMVTFIAVQAHLLARRFSQAFETSERLSGNLQNEVAERTQDLERKSLEALEASQQALSAKVQAEELRHHAENQAGDLQDALMKLKKTQERLVLQARMAALGTVAAGVAHEVRNPLTLTSGGAENLHERLDQIQEVIRQSNIELNTSQRIQSQIAKSLELIKIIKRGNTRIGGIVDNLSDFVHTGQKPVHTDCHLRSNIETVVSILGQTINEKKIEVSIDVEPGLTVRMNHTELNQVLMNILLNACQVLHQTGSIQITGQRQSDCIELKIIDDGPGVDPAIRDQIFDPFFTTRDAGAGTGLGLSISHTILTNSKAVIRLGEESHTGAEFIIEFPDVFEG
jgi:signal transduction histidine kinase